MSEKTPTTNYPHKEKFEKEAKRWLEKKPRKSLKGKHPWHDGISISIK